MYIVRFVRKGDKPEEEYYYQAIEDAKYHYSLFENDSSDLYERVELCQVGEDGDTIARLDFFALSGGNRC